MMKRKLIILWNAVQHVLIKKRKQKLQRPEHLADLQKVIGRSEEPAYFNRTYMNWNTR